MRRCATLGCVLWLKLEDANPQKMERHLRNALLRAKSPVPKTDFLRWISENVATIEIYWQDDDSIEMADGCLINEHFPIPRLARQTHRAAFDTMRLDADLSSTEAKLEHFLEFVQLLNQEVEWEETLRTTHKCTEIFFNASFVKIISLSFLSITLFNFLLVVISYQQNTHVMQKYSDISHHIEFGPGKESAFHCVMSETTWWLGDTCTLLIVTKIILIILAIAVLVLKATVEGLPLYRRKNKNLLLTVFSLPVGYPLAKIVFLLATPMRTHWIIVMVVTEYIYHVPAARKVLQSVTNPCHIWVAAIMLIIFVIFTYSIAIFQLYPKDFFEDNLVCQTLITCFLECFNYGMRNGGGVGDSLWAYSFQSHPEDWMLRVLLDLTFFLVVNVILLNVVFGVIIDKFGQFRDERLEQEKDKENVCYVCGKERSEISVFTDFTEHITSHHNIQDYWKYILYLRELEQQLGNRLMTGLQSHVLSLVNKQSFDWFPIDRALAQQKSDS